MHGSEPSDAIRVVNALLTQLDTLHSYSNVLVLATSNLTAAIDDAFMDRADLKLYVGLPSASGATPRQPRNQSLIVGDCIQLATRSYAARLRS